MKDVSVGILIHERKVLACQRPATSRYPLKWEFPGGKVEAGETGEQALVRELREELGIDAVIERLFHRQDWVYPENRTADQASGAYSVKYFLVRSFEGTPENHVFEQIRWVTPGELLDMDILEGNRTAVELLIRHTQEGQEAA